MTDKPSSTEPLGEANRSRRGRTIDLEATEIKDADAQLEALPTAQSAQSEDAVQTAQSADESLQRDGADVCRSPGARKYIDWKAMMAGTLGGAAVAAALAIAGFLIIRDIDLATFGTRLNRIEDALRQTSSSPGAGGLDPTVVEGLANRVARLEEIISARGSAPLDGALADRISGLERDLKALSDRVGVLAQQNEEATAVAREAHQRADANAAATTELARKVAALDNAAGWDKMAGEVRSLTGRLAAVESTLSKARDASGRFAVAVIALKSEVDAGQPFASELALVKSLGDDRSTLAPLEPYAASGVPSAAMLTREVLALMPALRAAVEPSQRGFLTRLQANAEKLVRIRPQEAKEGKEVSAILDRIEIKATSADINGVIAELEDLPSAVRTPADAWIEKARARSAAMESSGRLLAAALADLSK
jgi:hypothetical protein